MLEGMISSADQRIDPEIDGEAQARSFGFLLASQHNAPWLLASHPILPPVTRYEESWVERKSGAESVRLINDNMIVACTSRQPAAPFRVSSYADRTGNRLKETVSTFPDIFCLGPALPVFLFGTCSSNTVRPQDSFFRCGPGHSAAALKTIRDSIVVPHDYPNSPSARLHKLRLVAPSGAAIESVGSLLMGQPTSALHRRRTTNTASNIISKSSEPSLLIHKKKIHR